MARHEMVLQPRTPRKVRSLHVREEDAEVLDALRTFYAQRKGRALAEHETFTLVLADAVAHIEKELRASGFRLDA